MMYICYKEIHMGEGYGHWGKVTIYILILPPIDLSGYNWLTYYTW